MSHYQFESIHPFRDGNGRVGRLIAVLSLCKGGPLARPLVYISAYIEQHREEYYDLLLRVSTHGDWESWVRYFCDAVSTQAEDGLLRARRLVALREEYVRRVTAPRASALLPELINRLFERPAVRIADVAKMLKLTTQGADKLVQRLLDKDVLQEATGAVYGRVFIARKILEIVEAQNPEDV
jgi:Fic family protein